MGSGLAPSRPEEGDSGALGSVQATNLPRVTMYLNIPASPPQRVSEAMSTECLDRRRQHEAWWGLNQVSTHGRDTAHLLILQMKKTEVQRRKPVFPSAVSRPHASESPRLWVGNRQRASQVRAGRPRKAHREVRADLGLPPAGSPATGPPKPSR